MIREATYWLIWGPGLTVIAYTLAAFTFLALGVGVLLWFRQGAAYSEVREHMHPEREWEPVPAPRLWEPVYEPPRGEE